MAGCLEATESACPGTSSIDILLCSSLSAFSESQADASAAIHARAAKLACILRPSAIDQPGPFSGAYLTRQRVLDASLPTSGPRLALQLWACPAPPTPSRLRKESSRANLVACNRSMVVLAADRGIIVPAVESPSAKRLWLRQAQGAHSFRDICLGEDRIPRSQTSIPVNRQWRKSFIFLPRPSPRFDSRANREKQAIIQKVRIKTGDAESDSRHYFGVNLSLT